MPFQKGNKLGKGSPKKPEIEQLRQAMEKVQKEQDCTFLEHFVRQAYKDNKVMVALGKKIIPDLTASKTDLTTGGEKIIFVVK